MIRRALFVLAAAALAGACWAAPKKAAKKSAAKAPYTAVLFQKLPETCNTPDGMDLSPEGDVILAGSNFLNKKVPPALFKIDAQNKLSLWYSFPKEKGLSRLGPMGLRFGPDGNLYVADNHYFSTKKPMHDSRVLRINIKDGKPVSQTVVASGLALANGIAVHGDYIYCTDTFMRTKPFPCIGGIFRFKVGETGVKIKDLFKDPHLVCTIPSVNKQQQASCDGLVADEEGVLYCDLFGDGSVHKIVVDEKGKGKVTTLVPRGKIMYGDGMYYTDGLIYVADSGMNAIKTVDPKTGKVATLAENDDTTGADGLMDQPCEVIKRGKDLIVSNFDWPFPPMKNKKTDLPRTMSVIHLK